VDSEEHTWWRPKLTSLVGYYDTFAQLYFVESEPQDQYTAIAARKAFQISELVELRSQHRLGAQDCDDAIPPVRHCSEHCT